MDKRKGVIPVKIRRPLVLLALLMLAVLFSGCTSENQSNPNIPSNQMMNENNSDVPYGPMMDGNNSDRPYGPMMDDED